MLKVLSSKRIDYIMGEKILQKFVFFCFYDCFNQYHFCKSEPKELLFAIHASQIITICLVQNICNIEKCLQDNEEIFLVYIYN